MRTIHRYSLAIGTIITFLSLSASAQGWRRMGTDFKGLAATDTATVIAVGDFGNILRSTDAGSSWSVVPSGTTQNLFAVQFFDARHGILTGDSGITLRTNDAGTTWLPMPNNGARLFKLSFPVPRFGFALDKSSAIYRTIDSGASWRRLSLDSSAALFDILFLDAAIGIVVADSGRIFTTSDSGTTWSVRRIASTERLTSIARAGAKEILVGGALGSVFRSTDEGATWNPAGEVEPDISFAAISMLDSLNGIGVGSLIQGLGPRIVRTTDGGTSWTQAQEGIPNDQLLLVNRSLIMRDRTGFVLGNSGSIFRTTDAGSSWTTVAYTSLSTDLGTMDMAGVSFGNRKDGLIVGSHDQSAYLITSDGGATWILRIMPTYGFADVAFLDKMNVIVPTGASSITFKSSDAGETWTQIDSKHDLPNTGANSMFVLRPDMIFKGVGSLLYFSSDSAASWSGVTIPRTLVVRNLQFLDRLNGYVVSTYVPDGSTDWETHLYRTNDGGEEWDTLLSFPGFEHFINSAWFIDHDHGFVTTGDARFDSSGWMVLRTTDGGVSWDSTHITGGVPLYVTFLNDHIGYIVGTRALIMKTTDGGATWQRELPWTPRAQDQSTIFHKLYMLPDKHEIVVIGDGVMAMKDIGNEVAAVPQATRPAHPSAEPTLRVAPNPSLGRPQQVTIEGAASASAEPGTLTVVDLPGRTLLDCSGQLRPGIDGGTMTADLDLGGLADGVYVISYRKGALAAASRVVICR